MVDNVEHNTCTIDGAGTFHGIGIIAIKTLGSTKCKPVPKITVSSAEIPAIGHINIEYFNPSSTLPILIYKTIVNLNVEDLTFSSGNHH